MKGPALLIIDPQVDFHEGGSLPVSGAMEDAKRISNFINRCQIALDQIYVSLDSHHLFDISHPCFWEDNEARSPPPFTQISYNDVKNGIWRPVESDFQAHCLTYCKILEDSGRRVHTIWPPHCLIGSPGYNVQPDVFSAIQSWAAAHRKSIEFVRKGENVLTEHFSAFSAEVPMEDDARTQLNMALIESLKLHTKVIVCGQAMSHCVNYSTRDLVAHWPQDRIGSIILLKDGSSSMPEYEVVSKSFLCDMAKAGVTICEDMSSLDLSDSEH